MSSEAEKQPVIPRRSMQIHLSDLLATIGMLGVVLSWMTQSAFRNAGSGQLFAVAICFAVPAFLMLLLFSRASNVPNDSSAERLIILIGFEFVAWILGGFASLCVLNNGHYRQHEITAAWTTKAIAESEEIYFRTDYDKDGVREYAPTLRDLFETSPGAQDLLLVDPAMARAEGLPASAPTPKAGYCFVILHSQGANAPGGAKSYIDENGNMTGGYAVMAYPSTYNPAADPYQRNCYLISKVGTIYMRDLGVQTPTLVPTITTFDPDTNWKPCD